MLDRITVDMKLINRARALYRFDGSRVLAFEELEPDKLYIVSCGEPFKHYVKATAPPSSEALLTEDVKAYLKAHGLFGKRETLLDALTRVAFLSSSTSRKTVTNSMDTVHQVRQWLR